MAWTVAFEDDTEAKGIGTVTATYADESGAILAVVQRRVNTNDAKDVSAFCADAKASLEKQQAVETERAQYINKVFAELTKV